MKYQDFIELYEDLQQLEITKEKQLNEAVIGGDFKSDPKKIASGETSGAVTYPGPLSGDFYDDEESMIFDSDIAKAFRDGAITPIDKYLEMRAAQMTRDGRKAVQRPEERSLSVDVTDIEDIKRSVLKQALKRVSR